MERASYRVYTQRDLSSIPPSTLTSHRPRRGGLGWSGFLFLVVVGTMIGGSSYAALSVVKPDAHVTTTFAVPAPEPETLVSPKAAEPAAAPQPKPAEVTTSTKPIASAKPAPKPISIASIPRRPINPSPRVRPAPTPQPAASPLPPNPFDDPN